MTISKLTAKPILVIAFLAIMPLLSACGGGGGSGNAQESLTSGASTTPSNPPSVDSTAPSVAITGPTSSASYVTTNSTISLAGTATDNIGLSMISWTNSRGGSGSSPASGTTANLSFNIALTEGTNVITVTVTDTSGNTTQDQLSVSYTPQVTTGSVVLEWDPVVATNLAGYRVYYGTSSGAYQQVVSVGSSATFTLTGLSSGTRYYFVVTAFDTSGQESGYSNEVFKDIL